MRQFKKSTPCPYTPAQGCVVDHIEPLCAGGRDHPNNMQWQTRAAAREKDRDERRRCALIRKLKDPS